MKMRRKGTVLVLTLLIVTLMTAAALAAAANSYSIIGNAASYNDAQVAKEAAMAGVADLADRLDKKQTTTTTLVNFDDPNPSTNSSTDITKKKAPFVKYYSFTPQEKIKTISRCTNVAVIMAWDSAQAGYMYPNSIFTTTDYAMNNSNLLKDNGFKAFANPLNRKKIVEKTSLYDVSDAYYWAVPMGGPHDQGNVNTWTPTGTTDAISDDKYRGLFSNAGYLKYDLLILTLPDQGVLTLSNSDRDNLAAWIRAGGKLMIDSDGATYGIINPPFQGTDYAFKWDAIEKSDSSNTKGITSDEFSFSGIRNDTWVMNDAYNYNPADTAKNKIDWNKKTTSIAPTATQKVSGNYLVKQIYKNLNPYTMTYPSSAFTYVGKEDRALDTSFSANKIYLQYGVASSFGVGDRINILNIRPRYSEDLSYGTDGIITKNVNYGTIRNNSYDNLKWKDSYYYFNTTVDAVITEIDISNQSITFDPDSIYCAQSSIDYGARRLCIKADVSAKINDMKYYDFKGTGDNSSPNYGTYIYYANVAEDEYFTKKGILAYGLNNSTKNQYNDNYSKNIDVNLDTKLPNIWSGGNTGAFDISPTSKSVSVSDIRGYNTGSIIEIDSADTTLESLWGKVKSITYDPLPSIGGTMEVDLNFGPTPRSSHSMVYNGADKAYLVGGSDISNRFPNGSLNSGYYWSGNGADGMNMSISTSSQNDVWELQLDGSNCPIAWKLLTPTNLLNARPLPRFNSLVTYDQVNANILIAGGSVSWGDDNGVTSNSRLADVWKINVGTSLWTKIIDRPVANAIDTSAAMVYKQEIYGHKNFSSYYQYYYYIEPITPKTNDPGNPEIHDVILNANSNRDGYPEGLTVGDTISIYDYKDSSTNTEYVNLKGTISTIAPLEYDINNTRGRYTLHFNEPMTGINTRNISDMRALYIGITSSCNDISSDIPRNSPGAKCLAPGDVVTYYGAGATMTGSDDSQDMAYWGRVLSVAEDALHIQSKTFYQLYKGPHFMGDTQGYFKDESNGTLYIYGGYTNQQNQNSMWKLTNINSGTPTWRLIKSKGVTGSQPYNIYQNIGESGTSSTFSAPVDKDNNVIFNNAITSGTVNKLKIVSGDASGITIGMRYFVYPSDPWGGNDGRLWGFVERIWSEGGSYWIKFKDPLTREGRLGKTNETMFKDIASNTGLSMSSDYYRDNNDSTAYNSTIRKQSEIPYTSIIMDPTTNAPQSMRLTSDQAKNMYIGKTLTIEPTSVSNKIFTTMINNIEYNPSATEVQIIFKYQPSYSQAYSSNISATTDSDGKIFVITNNNKDYTFLPWVGQVDGAGFIDWKYVSVPDSTQKPLSNWGSASVSYNCSGGKDYVYLWGGSSVNNFLWKINVDPVSPSSWTVFKNNPDQVVIQGGRPLSLGGSTALTIGNSLLFFSGYYDYAIEKSDRNFTSLTDHNNVTNFDIDTDVMAGDSVDGSTVAFTFPLFSSVYDRNPIPTNAIFRLDDPARQDPLKLGTNGYAITSLGADFKVLATYPCNPTPTTITSTMAKVFYREDNEKVTDGVCSLANMALANVDNAGGLVFVSSRSLSGYGLADQIDKLELLNNAISESVAATLPAKLRDDPNYFTSDLALVDWSTWLNKVAMYYGYKSGSTSHSGITLDENSSFEIPGSPFYQYWDDKYHYYKNSNDEFYYKITLGSTTEYKFLPLTDPRIVSGVAVKYESTTVKNCARWYFTGTYHPGTQDMTRNAVFYMNLVAYTQSSDKVKVTGYYGGVTRAFLVTYDRAGSISSVDEVPAEE